MCSSSQDWVSSDLIFPLILHRWRFSCTVTCETVHARISYRTIKSHRESGSNISPHIDLRNKDVQNQSGLRIITVL